MYDQSYEILTGSGSKYLKDTVILSDKRGEYINVSFQMQNVRGHN